MRPDKEAFYFEWGINDMWIENTLSNRKEINPLDHTSLGMGFKHSF
jgi:hypothetical protein